MTPFWRDALVSAAVLFFLFIAYKIRPISSRRRRLAANVRAARDRARQASTPRLRAEALCEAAIIAGKEGKRWTAAAGLFLRAMRTEPTWSYPVEAAITLLQERRPRLLEKILWRRLAVLPWDEAHRSVVRAAADGLRQLYEKTLVDHVRAEVMKKLAVLL